VTPAIDIDNLTVIIGGKHVLSKFSLRLLPGQKVTLTGPSGCGKSTLLHSLLGFVVPEEGAIRIFGQEFTGSSLWQLRTRMAYVAQEPALGSGKVRDMLERPFFFRNNRHLRKNLHGVPELLGRLRLPDSLLDQEVAALSGGEKQRVALISAMLLDRDILLLDEASSALDQAAKQAVIELLKSREGLTVLSVSHDQEWMAFADVQVALPEKPSETGS
jgi:putative ABC transport system ATP-binding protein